MSLDFCCDICLAKHPKATNINVTESKHLLAMGWWKRYQVGSKKKRGDISRKVYRGGFRAYRPWEWKHCLHCGAINIEGANDTGNGEITNFLFKIEHSYMSAFDWKMIHWT